MPRIISPFSSRNTVGDAVSRAINQISAMDRITPQIRRAKLDALNRENAQTQALMNAVSQSGPVDWNAAAPAIVGSGYNPGQFNDLLLGRAANTHGAASPITQAAQVGAGGAYSSTADAFNLADATKRRGQDITSADRRYVFENTPVKAVVEGQPQFVPRSGAFDEGVQPILAKGLNITTPDGTTISQGGYGDLTKKLVGEQQSNLIDAAKFNTLANTAETFLKDPSLFGITGTVRTGLQDVGQLVNNVSGLLNENLPGGDIEQARADLAQSGLAASLPELYDPNLDAVTTLWGLLVYQGASALAGQSGRALSDKDVQHFKQMLGDPRSMFSSAEKMRSKIELARQLVNANADTSRQALNSQPLIPARPDVFQEPTETISSPENAGTSPETAVPVMSEADAFALPVGTYVKLGDQVFRVDP